MFKHWEILAKNFFEKFLKILESFSQTFEEIL